MGDGEKLLTHLNSALKFLLGLDIFPRVPKKKLNFDDLCNLHFKKGGRITPFYKFSDNQATKQRDKMYLLLLHYKNRLWSPSSQTRDEEPEHWMK